MKAVGGSFTARPWEAEIGIQAADPEGPAYGFQENRTGRSRLAR